MVYNPTIPSGRELEMQPTQRDPSYSNTMKEIGKARLRRRILSDPGLAAKLVALEASPVYNSRGELIQSLGEGTLHTTL